MSQRAWLGTVVLVALGVASPFVVQEIEGAQRFLPMHWPVMLAGLAFGIPSGMAVGIATTIVSLLVLPRAELSPEMGELLMYGIATGFLDERMKTFVGKTIMLVAAMIAGRILVLSSMIEHVGMVATYQDPSVMYPWPGVVAQLLVLPALATLLARWADPPPKLQWMI